MFKHLAIVIALLCTSKTCLSANLIQEGGTPSPTLIKLFNTLQLEHDHTVENLNKIAQEKFLRKPGQERWHMEDKYGEERDKILSILKELKVLEEIRPSLKHYNFIVVHGATVEFMRKRLKFLDTLWSDGVRADKIVFLTGERPLDPQQESEDVLFNQSYSSIPFRAGWSRPLKTPQTEAEGAKLAWDQVTSNNDLRQKDFQLISVPMIEEQGKMRRPPTADTVSAWLKEEPSLLQDQPVKILAISNNPYIPYQDQTVRAIFKKKGVDIEKISLETVGPAAGQDDSIAAHLDNIARWLYTEVNAAKI